MKIRDTDLFVYFFLIPSILLVFMAEIKYMVYALPCAFAITVLVYSLIIRKNAINFDIELMYLLLLLFIVNTIGALFNFNQLYLSSYIRDLAILFNLAVIFCVRHSFRNTHVVSILFVLFFCYLYSKNFQIELKFINSLTIAEQNNSNEFIIGFVFGVFVLHFYNKKEYFYLLLSISALLLSSKRVGYLGLFIAFPFLIFYNASNQNSKNIFLLLYYFGLAFIGYFMNEIAMLMLSFFGKNNPENLNNLLSSREVFNEILKFKFESTPVIHKFFGHGFGYSERYLQLNLPNEGFDKTNLANPHNDFFKILIDSGLIGLILYYYIFKRLFIVSAQNPVSFLYVLPVFLVDNSFVVLYYLIICGIIARVPKVENE